VFGRSLQDKMAGLKMFLVRGWLLAVVVCGVLDCRWWRGSCNDGCWVLALAVDEVLQWLVLQGCVLQWWLLAAAVNDCGLARH
jgi:hypothetical protein